MIEGMPEKQYHHGDLKNSLIQAGMEILAEEGAGGLSLRKAATRAGVSHSAPYAHFADKQDLIAAISAEGFRRLLARLQLAVEHHPDAAARLVEVAWAYAQFARENTALFKTMFSGILEKEQDYPEFVDISHQNFLELVRLVRDCQAAGLLRRGPAERLALSLWSLVHGFVSLLLEGQIPGAILDQMDVRSLLCRTLDEITLVDLTARQGGSQV
jgi:AcrR family transcriptional regulator